MRLTDILDAKKCPKRHALGAAIEEHLWTQSYFLIPAEKNGHFQFWRKIHWNLGPDFRGIYRYADDVMRFFHQKKSAETISQIPTDHKRVPGEAEYHSLALEEDSMPQDLEITARSLDDNEIMGIKHKKYPIAGIQCHPESILTKEGLKIMKNFLEPKH